MSTGPYKFEELLPGQSVNVQYFVEPKQTGPFESSPARVIYTPTAGGRPQVSSEAGTRALHSRMSPLTNLSLTLSSFCVPRRPPTPHRRPIST